MRTGIAFAYACCMLTACLGDNAPPAPPPGELVGTWRYLPKLSIGDVPVDQRQTVAFMSDGSYEIRSRTGVARGEFIVADRDLTLDPGSERWITTSFIVTPDRLLVDAMFPVDDVDGTAGVWSGAQSAKLGASTITLALDGDGTAQLEQTGPGAEVLTGTWTHVGADVVFTYLAGNGTPIDKHYQEVPGAAVGEWLYERITPAALQ
jgi:hypothetical protein